KNCAGKLFQLTMQSVTHESQCKTSLLYRPHRAAMVAVRVERWMLAGECAYSPTGEQLFRRQSARRRQNIILIHNAGSQAMPGVGGDGADGPAAAIKPKHKILLLLHPEFFVKAFFQVAGLMKKFSGPANLSHEEQQLSHMHF